MFANLTDIYILRLRMTGNLRRVEGKICIEKLLLLFRLSVSQNFTIFQNLVSYFSSSQFLGTRSLFHSSSSPVSQYSRGHRGPPFIPPFGKGFLVGVVRTCLKIDLRRMHWSYCSRNVSSIVTGSPRGQDFDISFVYKTASGERTL